MEKGRKALFKLLLVIFSFYYLGGEGVFFIGVNNIHTYLSHNFTSDSEETHHYQTANFTDEEKWLEISSFDFSIGREASSIYPLNPNPVLQEFPDSVWQPPEFI